VAPPLFSISVANWNNGASLGACLESVFSQRRDLFEFTGVDNGSKDGSEKLLRERIEAERKEGHPHRLELITYSANQGFGAAHNAAIAHSSGEIALVLNADARLAPGFLEKLEQGIRRHPEAAMYAVKIFLDDSGERLENVGLTFCADGQNRGAAHGELDRGRFEEPREAFCPSGAAGLYRREWLAKAGTFDASYFAYGEDFELGLRIRRAGGACRFLPNAVVHHTGPKSLGEASPERVRLIERNRLYTLLLHYPAAYVWRSPVATLDRFRVHWELARTTLRADLEALSRLPSLLWRRGEIARKFPMSAGTFEKWMADFGVSPEEMAAGV